MTTDEAVAAIAALPPIERAEALRRIAIAPFVPAPRPSFRVDEYRGMAADIRGAMDHDTLLRAMLSNRLSIILGALDAAGKIAETAAEESAPSRGSDFYGITGTRVRDGEAI